MAIWSSICGVFRGCRKPARRRSSLMLRTRSSSRGRAPMARAAGSAASFRHCSTPRPLREPTASSSRRILTPRVRRPTDRTWCPSINSPALSVSRSTSGSGRGGRRRCVRKLAPASERLVERGKRILALEAEAVRQLADNLDVAFARAVELLAAAGGRVIVSGVGKSGLIARKIAATFTSTGTPASFLHPVDSLHGDLGIVGRDDVAVLLSKSGASDELFGLVSQLKRLGVPLIAITGEPDSVLARQADVVLDASVAEEACPETLAPTASTTAALALGDALAVTLLEVKGFRREDFAALHPGGALGRNLLLRVADVMVAGDVPTLAPDRPMRECVVLLAQKRGTVAVVDRGGSLLGVVTAGDLTRLMEKTDAFLDLPVGDVMTRTPKTTTRDELAGAAVRLMEQHGVMALPVLDGGRKLVGMVHLHDLMKAGAA